MVVKVKKLKKLIEKLLDFVYPRKCIVCEKLFDIREKDRGVCKKCVKIFERPSGNTCLQCGRETKDAFCYVCKRISSGKIYKDNQFYYTKNYPVFVYNEASRVSIFELKYDKKLYILKGFEQLLSKYLEDNEIKADLIIPVPMHKKKEKSRGFNQAKLIGKLVSDITGIRYNQTAIIRNRNTSVQSNKTLSHRHENLEGCFSVINKEQIKGKVILLVDDIYTSGSTINMCAKELMQNGAKEVFSLTLSIVREQKEDIFEE